MELEGRRWGGGKRKISTVEQHCRNGLINVTQGVFALTKNDHFFAAIVYDEQCSREEINIVLYETEGKWYAISRFLAFPQETSHSSV